jgi:hypothetical protein
MLSAISLFLGLCALALALSTCRWLYAEVRRRRRWSDLPEVHWTRAEDSPFGRRVLDCRGYCKLMPPPDHEKLARGYEETRKSSVASLAGQLPEDAHPGGVKVYWRYARSDLARLRAGFHPHSIDDRWIIRYTEGRIYLQRSWTGALIYVAELSEGDQAIVRVFLRRSDADTEEQTALSLALVRYLLDSHVLGRQATVPVPGDLAEEPLKMALFAFSIAGRYGEYAEPFWPQQMDKN